MRTWRTRSPNSPLYSSLPVAGSIMPSSCTLFSPVSALAEKCERGRALKRRSPRLLGDPEPSPCSRPRLSTPD